MSLIKRCLAVAVVVCLLLTMSSCGAEPTYVDMTIDRNDMNLFFATGPEVYTLERLAREADVVVLADVNGIVIGEEGYDVTELNVRELWKGEIDEVFLVSEDGGVNVYPYSSYEELPPNDTTREQTPSGEPLMRRGNRVVLFLGKSDDPPYYYVCGGTAGKFFYDEDGTYHNCLTYSENYEALQNGEASAVAVDHLSLDEMAPKTKRELKRIVKDAL